VIIILGRIDEANLESQLFFDAVDILVGIGVASAFGLRFREDGSFIGCLEP